MKKLIIVFTVAMTTIFTVFAETLTVRHSNKKPLIPLLQKSKGRAINRQFACVSKNKVIFVSKNIE